MEEESSFLEPQASQDHLKGLRFLCLESPCQEHSVTGKLPCYDKEEPWLPLGHGFSSKAHIKALSQQSGLGSGPYPCLLCFSYSFLSSLLFLFFSPTTLLSPLLYVRHCSSAFQVLAHLIFTVTYEEVQFLSCFTGEETEAQQG